MKFKGVHAFVTLVILAVAAAIVASFLIIGSPGAERARSLDSQRVNSLTQISNSLDAYYAANDALPATLDALKTQPYAYVDSYNDPLTRSAYEYHTTSSTAYELCATFQAESSNEPANGAARPVMYPGGPYASFWTHSSGRTCFPLNVNVQPGKPKPPIG